MTRKIIFLSFFLMSVAFYSFEKINDYSNQLFTIDSKKLDANNISTWFRTNGNFNRDPPTGNSGFEWPKGTGKTARYSSGLWMGCKSGNDTLTSVAAYSYDFKNGYVDNSGNPQGENDPLYRIYTINRGDTTSPDYLNWPAYQGAYTTASGKPFFLGTQTMFYSYTDAYPHASGLTSDSSLKAQILQTNWCYTNTGLQDVNFTEFKIINRSSTDWVNTFVSFWTDDDLGYLTDDKIGCDTNRDLGYTYNGSDSDNVYGIAPPSVGTLVLRGPLYFTGNNNDTAIYYDPPGSIKLRKKVGYKFTGMSVFNTWNGSSPQPSWPMTNVETYRVLSGLWRLGNSWINPITGDTTKKVFTGDPVSGTGWNMPYGYDRVFILSCGPFNMSPNDTQSIIVAQVITTGSSNLNSITQLKNLSDHVKQVYDNNFQSVLAVNNISTEIPAQFTLSQNYPNPFNPVTHLKFGISKLEFVSLKVYDILGSEVKTLVNENKPAGTYEVEFDGSELTSGVYFYKLSAGSFTETKRMMLLK